MQIWLNRLNIRNIIKAFSRHYQNKIQEEVTHMKKKFLTIFSVIILAIVGLSACGKKSAADKDTWTVATSGTLYPTSYHDPKTKKLTG